MFSERLNKRGHRNCYNSEINQSLMFAYCTEYYMKNQPCLWDSCNNMAFKKGSLLLFVYKFQTFTSLYETTPFSKKIAQKT